MNYRKATLEDAAQVAGLYKDLAFHIKHTSKDPYWDFEDFPLEMAEQKKVDQLKQQYSQCVK